MPITAEELARRLKAAREQVGLTQEQVAEVIAVSRPAVTQLEAGSRSVSTLELERLATLYGRGISDFLAEAFDPDEVVMTRLRAAANEDEVDLLMRAGSWCSKVLAELGNLEALFEIDTVEPVAPFYQLSPPRNKWQAIQQGELVANEERQRLGIKDDPVADVSSLLEKQGVRTFFLELPEGVSGLSMMDPQWGFVVGAKKHDVKDRRRFSWMHEYGHIVMDRDHKATVSRGIDREALEEVRANSFAAAFLMPASGVTRAVRKLGKGRPSRERAFVVDGGEEEAVSAQRRSQASHQVLALEDVVRLSGIFGVSRTALLYRLLNLDLLRKTDFDTLWAENGDRGIVLAMAMGIQVGADNQEERHVPDDFRSHLVNLALRAFERGLIARSKLDELAELVRAEPEAIENAIAARGAEDAADVVIPDGLE